jgi:hypothetical protein
MAGTESIHFIVALLSPVFYSHSNLKTMKALKDVAIIEGNLARLLINYTDEFRNTGTGFEEFSDEAIIYSLLEYSKYSRDDDKTERYIYIHGKCLEYDRKPHVYIEIKLDVYDHFTVIYIKKEANLPF